MKIELLGGKVIIPIEPPSTQKKKSILFISFIFIYLPISICIIYSQKSITQLEVFHLALKQCCTVTRMLRENLFV